MNTQDRINRLFDNPHRILKPLNKAVHEAIIKHAKEGLPLWSSDEEGLYWVDPVEALEYFEATNPHIARKPSKTNGKKVKPPVRHRETKQKRRSG